MVPVFILELVNLFRFTIIAYAPLSTAVTI